MERKGYCMQVDGVLKEEAMKLAKDYGVSLNWVINRLLENAVESHSVPGFVTRERKD